MRPVCPRPVAVRGRIIGGAVPLICLPLAAAKAADLLIQARAAAALAPDLIEWRADRCEGLDAPGKLDGILADLRRAIGDVPLLFTCRRIEEAGFRDLDAGRRMQINLAAVASGQIDILDTELANGEAFIAAVRDACRGAAVRLLLSRHDFEKTPPAAQILSWLARAEALGADIAKAAVMPSGRRDVFTLLDATRQARSGAVKTALITISMGAEGLVSRVVGGQFGSDVTFAVGVESTAPGQVPIGRLRDAWRVLGIR